ncbi:MAG: 23S rRNA (uracil(1939)-C(5))-methyltransferase RlmD [Lachnospiraceae bacterium]|nr:23S rRNA (uracil(1939)-C(5))-methyltransferase RlmD [Lachnospiraceae bacterium]
MDYKKNDIVTIEIRDISHEGEGIGKIDGYPFFVKDTVIGDKAQVRVTRVKKNYAYGRLEKVLEPSACRREPACPFHRQCGGCQIQVMDYAAQLQFKEDKIRNNMIRIGGFAPALINQIMEPVVGMDDPFHYRYKAQYPVGTDREGNPVAGFYAGRTHNIIANTQCLLGVEENQEILEIILEYMRREHVPSYDESTGKGLIRHVLIRKGFSTGELMVCLVINWRGAEPEGQDGKSRRGRKNSVAGKEGSRGPQRCLPAQERLTRRLAAIPGMTSISVSINTENTNVIMGSEVHTIWGKDRITDVIHMRDSVHAFRLTGEEIRFSISPLSFYQVNPSQMERLYALALEYAQLAGTETVWDLYCGIGTISLFLAKRAKRVYGVEVIPEAIEDARRNADRNGIRNAEFFLGRAEEVLPEKYEREGIRADVIVVDPPRKGCDEACLGTMLRMAPERIVYVSCDSATLARDLRVLCDGGYEIRRIRGVDLFGQTVHTETCVLLSKLKSTQHIEVKTDLDEMDLTKAES